MIMKYILLIATILFSNAWYAFANSQIKEYLMPVPQEITLNDGFFTRSVGRMELDARIKDVRLLKEAIQLKEKLKNIGINAPLTRQVADGETALIQLTVNPDLNIKQQGYTVTVATNKIDITGVDNEGLFNGIKTMEQLISYVEGNSRLPKLSIVDFPDFKNRGVMLDVSRDKVPKLESLFQYIDHFASLKINQLQLYTEHTFEYQNHMKVWQDFTPYTAEDIIKINHYCNQYFIQLVPNQNALGHMERWLVHEEYQHLAELEHLDKNGTNHLHRRTTLSPIDPQSMELVTGMFDEMLPNFSSKIVNIGGDEPWELGYGRSKEECDKRGKGDVYISYMSDLTNRLSQQGYSSQMWADIVLNYPKELHRLPSDLTCMVWGYRSWYPFEKNSEKMHKAGVLFYVCPGTSSWQSFIGRWPNAKENLLKAAKAGKKYSAEGYLNTDWGDFGHWQPFVISYSAIIYGAGLSWSVDQNENVDVSSHISKLLFNDSNIELAQLIIELGNVYKLYDGDIHKYVNVFYDILRNPNSSLASDKLKHVNSENSENVIVQLDRLIAQLNSCPSFSDEQNTVKDELVLAARFARHSAMMARERLRLPENRLDLAANNVKKSLDNDYSAIMADFHRLWLVRNRAGGLRNSMLELLEIQQLYQSGK